MEKFFKLKENGTDVKTEILAGITTFMTMAYIIALNPNLLANFQVGTPLWNAVFLATVISTGIGTLLMALLANKPFAMAPGMGLNSYFAATVAGIAAVAGITYEKAFSAGMVIILLEGIVFTVLTLMKIREQIVKAIPLSIRQGIPAGIGLMLLNIGLTSNAGIYTADGGPFYMLTHFFGAYNGDSAKTTIGTGYPMMVLYAVCMLVGVFAIAILARRKIRGSVLLGMLISSVIYWVGAFAMGVNPFASLKGASFVPPFADMLNVTFFKFDFKTLFSIGITTAVMYIITFCMVDMFDTIGTLLGTARRAKMVDVAGDMPQMNEAMLSDAIGTVVGACTGTSTVTTFIESAAGVEEGGRTGLTSLTTAILFFAAMFLAPIAGLVPAPATSAALVYVGTLMMGSLKEMDVDDVASTVPVSLMLIFMVGTSGIGNGIGIGLIAYSIIKIFTGRAKEVSGLTIVLSVLFLMKFFLAL